MNILVLGGDERNFYLTQRLASNGYVAKWCCAEKFEGTNKNHFDIKRDISDFDAVVLPLSLTRDGKTLNCPLSDTVLTLDEVRLYIKNKKVFTSDSRLGEENYFTDKRTILANARLTAAGFLSELLNFEKGDIMSKSALVTGYGNVAKCTSKILLDNGVKVWVSARDEIQRKEAEIAGCYPIDFVQAKKLLPSFDYVVNTVPVKIFSDADLAKMKEGSGYFELASLVRKETDTLPFAYIDCRGMPGKHTPKGAGEVIADFICSKLRE